MSDCVYRPPWPDEIERLQAILEHQRTGSSWLRPRVWETCSPRRFAGAAVWCPPESGEAEDSVEISFRLRPRFCDPLLAIDLLRDLFAEILEAGFNRVRLNMNARDPWEKILACFGVEWIGLNECWIADALTGHERLATNATRWASRLPVGWSVRPLEESDAAFVLGTEGALDFFDPNHLQKVWSKRSQALSCLVETPHGPAGVLLATRFKMTGLLEFLGAAPEFRAHSPSISYLALRHFLRRDHPGTFDRVLSLVNPAKGTASSALMSRFGGSLTQTYHHFAGEIRVG